MRRFGSAAVAAVFRAYPKDVAARLIVLRELIFDTAATTAGVGALEETLKWSQPSYVTAKSGSGSTIRIDQVKSEAGSYAMYFHCQTTLVGTFRKLYRDDFTFQGNRSIVFDATDEVPTAELRHCVALALTYHLSRRGSGRARSA